MGLAAALAPGGLVAQTETQTLTLAQAQRDLMFGDRSQYLAALDVIEAYGKPDIAPGLILALRFSQASKRPIVRVLEAVTGAAAGPNWFRWMLWQEENAHIVPHESFTALKRDLFLRIDPNFADFFGPRVSGARANENPSGRDHLGRGHQGRYSVAGQPRPDGRGAVCVWIVRVSVSLEQTDV
jgi:hypothetical protein